LNTNGLWTKTQILSNAFFSNKICGNQGLSRPKINRRGGNGQTNGDGGDKLRKWHTK
jgi:hypothetical protein